MSEERILDAVRAEYEGRRQALKGIATGLPAVVGDGFRQTSGGSPSELATVSSTVTVVPRGRPRTGLPLVTDSDVQEHMDRARAPATNRKRFYTLRNYRELCVRQGNEPFPVTAVTLVEYIVSLTKKAIMYDTVCDYLGIVRVESRKFSESKFSQMEDEGS
ncbi:hypothetical protein FOZ60_006310 [Perkinsus olseni]|uniref:Uncharacterized protein n=1 Tax=Perkinsus olseni TaxID=32597 RepID=A0A7J6NP79_PEROL|nr:hypothetical protein FOZ60_006310 [Perkinsus olseni]